MKRRPTNVQFAISRKINGPFLQITFFVQNKSDARRRPRRRVATGLERPRRTTPPADSGPARRPAGPGPHSLRPPSRPIYRERRRRRAVCQLLRPCRLPPPSCPPTGRGAGPGRARCATTTRKGADMRPMGRASRQRHGPAASRPARRHIYIYSVILTFRLPHLAGAHAADSDAEHERAALGPGTTAIR